MNKSKFMQLMSIPKAWDEYGMYPEELFAGQVEHFHRDHSEVNQEHVGGSEHWRNGMFHWWLKRQPSKEELLKLVMLSRLDPDQLMAQDVRSYIARAKNADSDVQIALKQRA